MRKLPPLFPKTDYRKENYPMARYAICICTGESLALITKDELEGAQEFEEIGLTIGEWYFSNGKDLY